MTEAVDEQFDERLRDLGRRIRVSLQRLAEELAGMTTDIPPVEDSGIWGPMSAPPICPEPTFDEALTIVLSTGNSLRHCSTCQSPATTIVCLQYDYIAREGGIYAQLHETCQDCGSESTYHVPMGWWAAIEAMRVWEQGRTARAAIEAELANRADLEALDADASGKKKIPVALQWCRRCKRWLESRDGKAPCICPAPDVIEGPPGVG